MRLQVMPPDTPVDGTVGALPASKSMVQRDMVINALCGTLPPPPDPAATDDASVMARALRQRTGIIDLGANGTALRLLTAYYAQLDGAEVTLTGTPRLMQRPIMPLIEALRTIGADITTGSGGIHIAGKKLRAGACITIDAGDSSQLLSALCLIAPAIGGLTIATPQPYPSQGYVRMTLAMMARRGVPAEADAAQIHIAHGQYNSAVAAPEADWSAAAFWYETAAITSGCIRLERLALPSVQPDAAMANLGTQLGVVTEATSDGINLAPCPEAYARIALDMSGTPDLVPAVAAAAVGTGVPFRLTGIAHLRHKESDRIDALARALRAVGAQVQAGPDRLDWDGECLPLRQPPVIDTCGDHRLAMAIAPLAAVVPGIIIDDAECVAKSYPGFWDDLRSLSFTTCQL